MMLKFRSSPGMRDAAGGLVMGAFFPVACLLAQYWATGTYGGSLWAVTALCGMPAIGGVLFYIGGLSKRRLIKELNVGNEAQNRLSQIVSVDHLTGIANRFALLRHLGEGREDANGEAVCGALLLLDLDRFKFVNDTMGHAVGDELLVGISRRLTHVLSGVATVYRLGGDEFAIAVPGSPSQGKISDICETVKAVFAEPFALSTGQFQTGGSIGVAFRDPARDGAEREAILIRADLALYKAKETVGNSHRFYEPGMAQEALAKNEMGYDLSRALAAGEFFLEYQPIIGIDSGAIRSFEALIRWRHPQKGLIAPDSFIAAAERTGLILPIGNWVVQTACREAARWPAPTGVAVNVAGDQFKDRTFVSHVKACLAQADLAPGRLTIEVTESIFSVDAAVICDSLAELRLHGVRIALDDFGIGFSSINNLRRFPLDQIKVDRSFTSFMLGNRRDGDLVDIILKLGAAFQVGTTIEGIETESQLDFVRALGASEAQGFLISRPVSAQEAMAILDRGPERGMLRA